MTERIDFALEPGVILFAVLFFVLVNVLLAAVLYPYFRDKNAVEEGSSTARSEEPAERMSESASDREPMEERVDEFLEEIHRERERV
jgi:uncharacterized membrane protein YraQ (UPF0718 family)